MAAAMAAPFKMGKNKVFLPTSVYTLVRGSGSLPPNQAMFHVPLNTNKFDVRDYLYNLYGLVTTNVKVMIQQAELQRGTSAQRRANLHMRVRLPWKRPQSSKRVIVTMTSPFKYPDPPKAAPGEDPFNLEVREQMKQRSKYGRRGLGRGLSAFAINGRV
ncbi:Predicted protein [Taphrina deformans PYCC 5710]|uniref:Large ribosomal subunit protein uL23m n=1 Tax=Taphrina deformans (strain PYCC 5710 / ATCC 11124 / CBS 356.35 / IMI 108563 / JCM 9778 / NBRC 8474) TaxID=1097556 RepID=R4XE05_TAPDE|nr:Predicted protein [Taphrina deformans PYCC 5710]|eukprot:CCG82655.1 Predicted protein [Taphrina deformans PYCC 5710]